MLDYGVHFDCRSRIGTKRVIRRVSPKQAHASVDCGHDRGSNNNPGFSDRSGIPKQNNVLVGRSTLNVVLGGESCRPEAFGYKHFWV